MNQQILDYLQKNKDSYTKESLVEQLQNAGYANADITSSVIYVYGEKGTQLDKINQKFKKIYVRFGKFVVLLFIIYGLFFVGTVLSGCGFTFSDSTDCKILGDFWYIFGSLFMIVFALTLFFAPIYLGIVGLIHLLRKSRVE
jgi:hypothetical protein